MVANSNVAYALVYRYPNKVYEINGKAPTYYYHFHSFGGHNHVWHLGLPNIKYLDWYKRRK